MAESETNNKLSAEAKEVINDYLYKRARDFFALVGITGLGSLIYLIVLVPKIAQNQIVSLIGFKEVTETVASVNVVKSQLPSLREDANNLKSAITQIQNTGVEDAKQKVQEIQAAYSVLSPEEQSFVQGMEALLEKNAELETQLSTVQNDINILRTNLGGLRIIVLKTTTDGNGMFSIAHNIQNYDSIVGATFAVNRYAAVGDDATPGDRGNYLWWDEQYVNGGIKNESGFRNQPVSVTLFVKE
jgi:competence protein ComGC